MRFYLDQNLTPRVTAAARRLGVDVTDWQEDGMEHSSDEEQLTHATAQGRVVVTCDVEDFSDLAQKWIAEGKVHAGIVFVPQQIHADVSGSVARSLRRLSDLYPGELVENAVMYLSLG